MNTLMFWVFSVKEREFDLLIEESWPILDVFEDVAGLVKGPFAQLIGNAPRFAVFKMVVFIICSLFATCHSPLKDAEIEIVSHYCCCGET